MEFNTQICTNKEQSKRLIDLGLNPNTSDMHHYRYEEGLQELLIQNGFDVRYCQRECQLVVKFKNNNAGFWNNR